MTEKARAGIYPSCAPAGYWNVHPGSASSRPTLEAASVPGAALLGTAAPLPNRPKVPGPLSLRARRRVKGVGATEQVIQWPVARTAIVICDMWDTQTFGMSAQRVALMAPPHEPGGQRRTQSGRDDHSCAERHHENSMKAHRGVSACAALRRRLLPFRSSLAARVSPMRNAISPSMIQRADAMTRSRNSLKGLLTPGLASTRRSTSSASTASARAGGDLQLLQARRYRQDRANGRSYQHLHLESRVRYAPDDPPRLRRGIGPGPDSMYDPRTRPFVNHARGTELVIENIVTMWCASILSEDLTRVIPGSADAERGADGRRTAR
jgi:hypothetical protein